MVDNHYQTKEFCYYHPKQVLIGVCPLCLNQKLLLLASLREDAGGRRKPAGNIVGFPAKVFALGSLLRHRHLSKERPYNGGSHQYHNQSDPSSLEDSFISIKFEENGVALWDNSKVGKDQSSTDHMGLTKEGSWRSSSSKSTVVEHPKEARGSLRWRKRIGYLLQLLKWKRPKIGSGRASHVKGWIGALPMRRANKD